MSNQKIKIDQLTTVIMDGLEEYAKLAANQMKVCVKKSGNTVKKQIAANAPEKTGQYAKSWRTKTTKESSNELTVTVYSPKRYMLAHLLENGHAKRGGGRVRAIPHIAPAQTIGEKQLEGDIERALKQL